MWLPLQTPPHAAAAPPPAKAAPPTPLSGVEVVAPRGGPKVVASYPAPGAAVAPGELVLMVRFDHAMKPDSWSYGGPEGGPDCLKTPRLLKDGRTFVLLCTVGFQKSFTLALNGPDAVGAFRDTAGARAQPYPLAFTSTDADPVLTVPDALKAAGLEDTDSPILTSDPGVAPK